MMMRMWMMMMMMMGKRCDDVRAAGHRSTVGAERRL